MAYRVKKVFLQKREKAFLFVKNYLSLSMKEAQRFIDRRRLYESGKIVSKKNAFIEGEIELVVFEPNSKGLKPIFQTEEFALFDKPSGVLIHPKNRKCEYSLTDEIRSLYGQSANAAHRIDKETSGLVLAGKTKKAEIALKTKFETREISKGYIALVRGKLQSRICIDAPISKNREFSKIRLKVVIDKKGKPSQTMINPIKYFEKYNATLVEAVPLTGRQHQIRVHLFHVEHPIVGDPIYGVDTKTASEYLDGNLSDEERIKETGAKRLMLHADWIEFEYKSRYKLYSKYDFLKEIDEVCNV